MEEESLNTQLANMYLVPKKKTLTLETSDGARFEVSEAAAAMMGMLRGMWVVGCTEKGEKVDVPMVAAKAFAMIVEWCEKHADKSATKEELTRYDSELVKDMDQSVLYDLLLGADFVDVPQLVQILTEKAASMIRGKDVRQIRDTFHIVNDLPPDLEAEVRQNNVWAFE